MIKFLYTNKNYFEALDYYIAHPDKAVEMGRNARKVVEEQFEQKELFRKLAAHRNQLIETSNE